MWIRFVSAVVITLSIVIVAACSANPVWPTATMQPRPVATAREAATYATQVPTPTIEKESVVSVTPDTALAASPFKHPWPVGTKITVYTTNDELTVVMVDEVIVVLPEFEAYVVLGRYVPDVWLVPWALMQATVAEVRGGQYGFARVEWYAPGQTPVVLWDGQ